MDVIGQHHFVMEITRAFAIFQNPPAPPAYPVACSPGDLPEAGSTRPRG
jgi:hypothetical protein